MLKLQYGVIAGCLTEAKASRCEKCRMASGVKQGELSAGNTVHRDAVLNDLISAAIVTADLDDLELYRLDIAMHESTSRRNTVPVHCVQVMTS